MPILEIQIVLKPNEELSEGLAAQAARIAAKVLGALPGHTWVKLFPIKAEYYAEDDSDSQPAVFPVFVSILKRRRGPAEELEDEARSLAFALAAVCDRPVENVHILYEEEAAGRVAFGGHLQLY